MIEKSYGNPLSLATLIIDGQLTHPNIDMESPFMITMIKLPITIYRSNNACHPSMVVLTSQQSH